MELLKLFVFGLLYLGVTLFLGRFLLSLIKINFSYELLNYSIGFFLIEGVSFLSFVTFGLIGYDNFLVAFLPGALLIIIYLFFITKPSFVFAPSSTNLKVLWWPALTVFSILTLLYFVNAKEQFLAVLGYNGIVYQDIAYHSGIAQSMINFGFPVLNLQYYESTLNYHFFTHFLTAKISVVSFTNPFISYHVFLNFLGVLFYSFLSVSLVRSMLSSITEKQGRIKVWTVVICLTAFFCTFLVGGILNYGYVSAFYFSSSFQWQLFIMIAFFMVIIEIIRNNEYSKTNIFVLLLIFFVATITKVSSLPLLFTGVFSLLLHSFFFGNKKSQKYWGNLLLWSLGTGILTFLVFFKANKSESSLLNFNLDLVESTPVVAFFRLENTIMILTVFVLTVFSFRIFLLMKIKQFETWFSGSILLAGLVLSLLFKDNQVYFLFPAIILGSHVSLVYIFSFRKNFKFIGLALSLLILSFYPVGGLGTFIDDQLKDREDYFPMTQERVELYEWLKNNSAQEEILFTTSVYANPEMMADNYFPAAMTGRRFYLGGYRFGGIQNKPEFSERLHIVQNFKIDSRHIWNNLAEMGINYILIEEKGNFDNSLFDKLENFEENEYYEQVYTNSYGIILRVLNNK